MACCLATGGRDGGDVGLTVGDLLRDHDELPQVANDQAVDEEQDCDEKQDDNQHGRGKRSEHHAAALRVGHGAHQPVQVNDHLRKGVAERVVRRLGHDGYGQIAQTIRDGHYDDGGRAPDRGDGRPVGRRPADGSGAARGNPGGH